MFQLLSSGPRAFLDNLSFEFAVSTSKGALLERDSASLVLPPQRPRPGVICTLADVADKVGIPVTGVNRSRNQRRNPEMVYVTPLSSLTCVVAP